jgi:hypothetical protein
VKVRIEGQSIPNVIRLLRLCEENIAVPHRAKNAQGIGWKLNSSLIQRRPPNQQRLYIPVMASEEYKGFHVSAWARPEHGKGSASVGIACKPKPNGSIVKEGLYVAPFYQHCFVFLRPYGCRSFSRSLWRGLLRRRATPVWE